MDNCWYFLLLTILHKVKTISESLTFSTLESIGAIMNVLLLQDIKSCTMNSNGTVNDSWFEMHLCNNNTQLSSDSIMLFIFFFSSRLIQYLPFIYLNKTSKCLIYSVLVILSSKLLKNCFKKLDWNICESHSEVEAYYTLR